MGRLVAVLRAMFCLSQSSFDSYYLHIYCIWIEFFLLQNVFQERQEYADVIKQLRAELAIKQQKVEEMQSWIAMQKAGQSQQLLVQMLELQNRVSFDVEDWRPNVWLDINLTRLCNSLFCKHPKWERYKNTCLEI